MRALRSFLMFLAVAVVFAHSISSHHHHVQAGAEKHSIELAHHYDRHHDDGDSEDHSNSPFSFSQIDEAFLSGKVQFSKIVALPVLFCIQWIVETGAATESTEFFIADVDVPPPISHSSVSFRGPPQLV